MPRFFRNLRAGSQHRQYAASAGDGLDLRCASCLLGRPRGVTAALLAPADRPSKPSFATCTSACIPTGFRTIPSRRSVKALLGRVSGHLQLDEEASSLVTQCRQRIRDHSRCSKSTWQPLARWLCDPDMSLRHLCVLTLLVPIVLCMWQGGELGRTAGLPYKFEFYLKRSAEANQPALPSEAQPADLDRVAVTLPPPVRACPASNLQRTCQVKGLLHECHVTAALLVRTGSFGVIGRRRAALRHSQGSWEAAERVWAKKRVHRRYALVAAILDSRRWHATVPRKVIIERVLKRCRGGSQHPRHAAAGVHPDCCRPGPPAQHQQLRRSAPRQQAAHRASARKTGLHVRRVLPHSATQHAHSHFSYMVQMSRQKSARMRPGRCLWAATCCSCAVCGRLSGHSGLGRWSAG